MSESESDQQDGESEIIMSPSPAYFYRFTLAHPGEARSLLLEVRDRREFLVRELKRLPAELARVTELSAKPEAVAYGAHEIRPRLRTWLSSFLQMEEVERLLGPVHSVPPNCS